MKPVPAPRTELVVVGDELLSGRTIDTNSAFIGRRLGDLGIVPAERSVVADRPEDITSALERSLAGSELVFVLGGLGPTPDDRTLDAVARLTGRELKPDPTAVRRIKGYFRRAGRAVPAGALRQALVPRGARTFPNPAGMVPGMTMAHGPSRLVLLPGVPVELRAIWDSGVGKMIESAYRLRPRHTVTVRTFGVPEATLAARLTRVLGGRKGVEPAFYPSTSGVDVVLRSGSLRALSQARRAVVAAIGPAVYEVGTRALEEVIGEKLKARNLKLAVAESCTGGLVGDRVTDIPGSSAWFRGGVTAYANEVKTGVLGVRLETLGRHGAVSRKTVVEMARGVCRVLGADVGIAVSGIAGPGGGTSDKPVGLVYVAVAHDGRVQTRHHRFTGTRRMVKERAATAALDLCRRVLSARAGGRK